jgi:hypothetical protein
MSTRRIAWALWACTILCLAAAIPIGGSKPGSFDGGGSIAVITATTVFLVTFASVGLVVALRRPRNPIGWLLCAGALITGIASVASVYADYAFAVKHGHVLGATAAAWVTGWIWNFGLAPGGLLAPLLFPDGRLPTPRWRPIVWIACAGVLLIALLPALDPGRVDDYPVANPIGVPGAHDVLTLLAVIGGMCLALSFVAVLASLVVRFRRSHGNERQQLKWLSYSVAVIAAGSVISGFVEPHSVDTSNAIESFALVSYPIAIGVAMLRHRLYDIDVVINRTLVYAALTATLAAAYLGSVLLLQLTLDPVTSGSSLAVAVSTLAVAALFRPARSRIQSVVDKRFYRRRYDAQQTLEDFSARLREQVDLETLGGELRSVVAETMQPAHVSLWLREASR